MPKSKQEMQGMRWKRNEMGKKSENKESFAQGKAKGWAKASVKGKILPKSKKKMQGMRWKRNEMGKKSGNKETFAQGKAKEKENNSIGNNSIGNNAIWFYLWCRYR